jgi:hypothetical protein
LGDALGPVRAENRAVTYAIRANGVALLDANGHIVWSWRPPSGSVAQVLRLPDSEDVIARVERLTSTDIGPTNAATLYRLRPDRSVAWTAATPEDGHDSYVDVRWNRSELVANSWSGWFVVLDPSTGAILRREFAK